ncbi:unnamed protein product [Moneuplotes crassus]|uniref:SH3 domain-containing protein n=1 Tax=Euplotes crassus TaxID=5936 RepID=A0AAD2DCY8_EUPCR|nr:unnamed protein product [Moneuplotes crassus]
MKTVKSNWPLNEYKNTKTPLFSNHGSLSSNIIGKYKGEKKVASLSKGRIKSKSRLPACDKSPKAQKFANRCVMYNQSKENSKSFVRAKTPNLGYVDDMVSRNSFSKPERPQRIPRDRKSIRNKQKEIDSNHDSEKLASPKKRSGKKAFKISRSPHHPSSGKKVHSPFFNNSDEKKSKKVKIHQPKFEHDSEMEEEPRTHVHFHEPDKENVDHNLTLGRIKDYQDELEKAKKTKFELKDTIKKLMESHLAEKKRMVENFEKETENYFKYYQFYHDNEQKLKQMTEDTTSLMAEKKEMEDKIHKLQVEVIKAKAVKEETKSTCKCEEYGRFCNRLKAKFMDSLHEIMRNDKSDQLKIANCQRVVVNTLNEVKSFLEGGDYEQSKPQGHESVAIPEIKTYSTDNDDELIRTVEEALLIVRNDSCKKTHFKSQRSLSSLGINKSPEPHNSHKGRSPEFMNNAKSNNNLYESQLRRSANEIKETSFQDGINESFGKAQPESTKNQEIKYTVEFLGKSHCDESQESEEAESEIESYEDYKGISIDQTSDDDTLVDNVINKITTVGNKGRTNERYKQETGMNDFEFTNENIFTKSNDLFCPISSRDSTLDKIETESQQQSRFNLPLQVENKKKLNDDIELAVCLFDFKPQKKTDLGFKAGERIKIVKRKEHANWWFGSIGSREGYFPKNYVKLKKIPK